MNEVSPDRADQARELTLLTDDVLRKFAVQAAEACDAEDLDLLVRAYLQVRMARKLETNVLTEGEYLRAVRRFVAWIQATNGSLLTPGRRLGEGYLSFLAEPAARINGRTLVAGSRRVLQPATRQKYLAGARVLYRAFVWAGASNADPFADLHVESDPTPAIERHPPYRTEDVKRVLSALQDPFLEMTLLLAAHAGLRFDEALGVKWSDVEDRPERTTLRVHGKGNKRRTTEASRALRAAIRSLPRQLERPDHLLPYADYWKPMRQLKAVFAVQGVPWRGFHGFRKSAATRLYRAVGDVHQVSLFLGHSSDKTTRAYVQADTSAVSRALSEF